MTEILYTVENQRIITVDEEFVHDASMKDRIVVKQINEIAQIVNTNKILGS